MTKPEAFTIDPREVTVREDRHRQEFDLVQMEDLKKSIRKLGQIQPIVVTREMELVAGERRLRACTELEQKVVALYVDQVDELILQEMELHENVYRADLTPQEVSLARAAMHGIWVKIHGDPHDPASLRPGEGQTQQDTASALGISRPALSEDLVIAKLLPHVPQLQKAKTRTEMLKELKKLKKQAEWHQAAEAAEEVTKSEDRKMLNGKKLTRDQILEGKVRAWDKRLIVCDAMEKLTENELYLGPPGLVFWDPPWGVELQSKINDGVLQGESYEDSEKKFKEEFPVYAKLIFEIMRPDSHLYCFFGIVHHEFVYNVLADCGFEVNRRPIIWVKPGIRSTRQPDKWPGAGYEPIAFARKGNRDTVEKLPDSITDVKPLTPDQKKGHPSAKPPGVYRNLLRRSCYPGDVVLDPMYGSGAAFCACELEPALKPMWYGWEIDKSYRNKAIVNLLESVTKGG